MIPHISFDELPDELPDDHPDRLENSGLSKLYVSRLQRAYFKRLTDFDGMTDVELLRQPGLSSRIVKAIREARARLALPERVERNSES